MKKARKALSVLLAAALFLSLSAGLAGCQKGQVAASASPDASAAASADTKISVTDSRGKTVEFDNPAEKIVCLLNSGLNDLEMLGEADKVVGLDAWTYTNAVTYNVLSKLDSRIASKEIPAVDDNMEKIISLAPDVVIIWAQDNDKIATLESQASRSSAFRSTALTTSTRSCTPSPSSSARTSARPRSRPTPKRRSNPSATRPLPSRTATRRPASLSGARPNSTSRATRAPATPCSRSAA